MSWEEDEIDLMMEGSSNNETSVTDIQIWIKDILADVPQLKVLQLSKKIFELGPSCKGDLKYLTEEKIKGILSDLRTARFLQEIRQIDSDSSNGSVAASTSARIRRNDKGFDRSVIQEFDFSLIKGNLLIECQKNTKLTNTDLKELARIVGKYCVATKPSNMHMTVYVHGVSLKICKHFSHALLDMFDGQVLGVGNKTLYDKVYHWIENQRDSRNSISQAPKRKRLSNLPTMNNSAPQLINAAHYHSCKEIMKSMFDKPSSTWDFQHIRQMIAESFPLQRKEINATNLEDIQQSVALMIFKDWPFLFHPIGAAVHFTAGTEYNPNNALDEFLTRQVTNLRYFIIFRCGAEAAKIDIAMQQGRLVARVGGGDTRSLYLITILAMLAEYFTEDLSQLFVMLENSDTLPSAGCSAFGDKIPNTPCLVGKGPSRLSCGEFYFFVDSIRVAGPYSALQGMKVLFPTHFMLNIAYNPKVSCTLEFYEKVIAKHTTQMASKKVIKAINEFEAFVKKMQ